MVNKRINNCQQEISNLKRLGWKTKYDIGCCNDSCSSESDSCSASNSREIFIKDRLSSIHSPEKSRNIRSKKGYSCCGKGSFRFHLCSIRSNIPLYEQHYAKFRKHRRRLEKIHNY